MMLDMLTLSERYALLLESLKNRLLCMKKPIGKIQKSSTNFFKLGCTQKAYIFLERYEEALAVIRRMEELVHKGR